MLIQRRVVRLDFLQSLSHQLQHESQLLCIHLGLLGSGTIVGLLAVSKTIALAIFHTDIVIRQGCFRAVCLGGSEIVWHCRVVVLVRVRCKAVCWGLMGRGRGLHRWLLRLHHHCLKNGAAGTANIATCVNLLLVVEDAATNTEPQTACRGWGN